MIVGQYVNSHSIVVLNKNFKLADLIFLVPSLVAPVFFHLGLHVIQLDQFSLCADDNILHCLTHCLVLVAS